MTDTNGNGGGGPWKWIAGVLVTLALLLIGVGLRDIAQRVSGLESRQFEGRGEVSDLRARVAALEARGH